MSDVKKCVRCGLQSSTDVNVTATCKKCGNSYVLCKKCSYSWKNQKCPSCNHWNSAGTWNLLELDGAGKVSDDMLSYLNAYNPNQYWKQWATVKETREAERNSDGDSKHRGVELASEEVLFLRELEDLMKRPIYTVGDDRSSYVIIKNNHVEKLRIFNGDIRNNMPPTISNLTKLKEFRAEKQRPEKGTLYALPPSFSELSELETIILRSMKFNKKFAFLDSLPSLKNLAIVGCLEWSSDILPLEKFTNLIQLNVASNEISNKHFETIIGGMDQLEKLKLSTVQDLTELPQNFKNLINLEQLDMRFNRIGKNLNKWPEWLVEMPKLNLIFRDYYQKDGWEPILKMLEERNPEAYPGKKLSPEEEKAMDPNEIKDWWENNQSQIIKDGWLGVQ